jgi:hypothetical protein
MKFESSFYFDKDIDQTNENDFGRADKAINDESVDTHRSVPRPAPDCLYGLVGKVAKAGSMHTEANPFAIAASMLTYLGAAVGRGPNMSIGDEISHARLFFVHVGRSSLGRKGTAKKLIYKINKAVEAIDVSLVPQIHNGGLSSREGLALMIHDGYKEGKNEIPGITDKRLFVVESEFANILQQSKRDGNTLSAALRDAWDGTSIRPAVKTCRVWASDPHIGIIGDVTPTELRELMHKRELTNGFANRILFFWAESDKVEPFPEPTPNEVVCEIAENVAAILRFSRANQNSSNDQIRMDFSEDAKKLYANLYKGELRDRSAGEHITSLLDRRATMLRRLAMLFALTDMTKIIDANHLNAAMFWVRFWTDSVKFIFQSSFDEVNAVETSEKAQRIVDYLSQNGPASRTSLIKYCFKSHIKKQILDQALSELLTACPPIIDLEVVPRTSGQSGSPVKLYKLISACQPSQHGELSELSELGELSET